MVLLDGDQPTVLSVQKYESGPPVDQSFDGQLVSPATKMCIFTLPLPFHLKLHYKPIFH